MRTTLTLDDDVAALLKRVLSRRGAGLKAVVNEALQVGLRRMSAPPQRTARYRTPSVDSGRCLLANVDDIAEVLSIVEGESYSSGWYRSRDCSSVRAGWGEAWWQVEAWLDCQAAWIPMPTERRREILGVLLRNAATRSTLAPDAHLAALAIEHGLTLCSTDGDFARFAGLRWENPLA